MKNSGFTLVELLAVISIIAIIFILIFPSVEHIIFEGRKTISDSQINTILDASYDLSLKNLEILPNKGESTYITLAQLKSVGLVETNITDPKTKELYPNNLVIKIENVGAGYEYSNANSKLKGDYLYTVVEQTNIILDDLPKIVLDTKLSSNSTGDFVGELDLNTEFENINYTAESSEGIDLTNKVFSFITYKDKIVSNVDTSKLGIYKIYYTVVDDLGLSTTVTVNLIVTDKYPPSLELPEDNTISKTENEFNLFEGVKCIDNSGTCNITTSGTINFGEVGKYVITYTAQDSSGNTTNKERIITIE